MANSDNGDFRPLLGLSHGLTTFARTFLNVPKKDFTSAHDPMYPQILIKFGLNGFV